MKFHLAPAILFLLTLISIGVGYLLLHPEIVGWCASGISGNCLDDNLSFGVGEPLYWGARYIPILFFVLIFVRKEVFNAWWKVILPISIFALYLIITAPLSPEFYQPDRTTITEELVWLINIVSIFVIAWKYWRLSRKERKRT